MSLRLEVSRIGWLLSQVYRSLFKVRFVVDSVESKRSSVCVECGVFSAKRAFKS